MARDSAIQLQHFLNNASYDSLWLQLGANAAGAGESEAEGHHSAGEQVEWTRRGTLLDSFWQRRPPRVLAEREDDIVDAIQTMLVSASFVSFLENCTGLCLVCPEQGEGWPSTARAFPPGCAFVLFHIPTLCMQQVHAHRKLQNPALARHEHSLILPDVSARAGATRGRSQYAIGRYWKRQRGRRRKCSKWCCVQQMLRVCRAGAYPRAPACLLLIPVVPV